MKKCQDFASDKNLLTSKDIIYLSQCEDITVVVVVVVLLKGISSLSM